MTISVDLVVIAVVVAAIGAWWALCSLVFLWLLPRLNRWLWHRLGGTGEPPE